MKRLSAVLLALMLAGCPDETTSTPPDATATPDVAADVTGPDVDEGPPARQHRRMTIDQIRSSVATVTGGMVWTEVINGVSTDMLAALGPTMGAPDYLLVTEENLEPTLVVTKFMADMSKRLCPTWAVADRDKPLAERTFVSTQENWFSIAEPDVRANLRRLEARFFGRWLPEDGSGDAAVDDAYTMFVAAGEGAPDDPTRAFNGWMAVCIAYFTDPDFVAY